MRFVLFLLSCLIFFPSATTAAINAADLKSGDIKQGIEAYNDGDYETAERLLKPYEGKLSATDRILQIIAVKKKNDGSKGREKDAAAMREGKTKLFDKYGMTYHAKGRAPVGMTSSLKLSDMATRAKHGNIADAYLLGLYFQDGFGVPQNMSNAFSYFNMAAQKKHDKAMNNLGFYYRYGIGVKKDEEKARRLFRDAVLLKNPYAAYNLALLHYDGINKTKNMVKAFLFADWTYRNAAGKEFQNVREKAATLKEKAAAAQTRLQKAYLAKFVPADTAVLFSTEYLAGRQVSDIIPPLPPDGKIIRKTTFMTPFKQSGPFKYALEKDPEKIKDADLIPLLPPFLDYDPNAAVTSTFDTTNIAVPAPFPEDADVLAATYYRPALPRAFSLVLNKSVSGIPLMVGDTLELRFYTQLHETDATEKGANFTIDNTDYQLFIDNARGVIRLSAQPEIIPLNKRTAHTEGWVALKIKAKKAGKVVLNIQPTKNEAFGYRFTIVVVPRPAK